MKTPTIIPTRVEVSHRTIVFTVVFLLFLWFLYSIRAVLLAILIASILMFALNPLVTFLEKRRLPRPVAILLLFIIIVIGLSGVIAAIIPPLVDQTKSLIDQFPAIVQSLGGLKIDQRVLSDQLGPIPKNIARIIIGAFSNIIAVFTLLVVTFYLLSERANLHRYLIFLFGNDGTEEKAEEFVNKLEHGIGSWVRGQLTLMALIGLFTYVGLRILGVNYALPLSILAGILEIIPNIGPTVSMIPAVLVALAASPITALATVALFFLVQQFENNIIVPKVMQKAVGVKPLVTIIALMTGVKLAGVLGAILAVPGYLILRIIVEEIYTSDRFRKT
ncbi:MAG: hypothetical protein A3F04_00720 [Candidatus Chisholmbacteria bacterium RIFCSPHIGHO2_12_FULL_49_9]|uniref:AI-2E family transporter n=1 Tax=Candidatus Chisholmbacteria bacterium RIFCSPHIGHO2_01_FULL_52_32 TaxID=1797591 RepID=A0A1G1VTX4_9BACT|nr:MAG: hypothetical protein A2786_04930 [Candidatus Chisholmbacteria bacterium RIFCSPHIGHO2_01_FULL_52_32]OGY19820.1 MAG: hypothetical protein A2900_01815 [Candidatus Chisholmbacteria bacterium RIFCSPLOWO2_01_FULL_50_28]OGY21243.1 MAG: hypothetical protein A3F04_00720 [Candidatus Chisholmbacteria bacterium RIFCSPHIGHO2_12_FULL_49_9]